MTKKRWCGKIRVLIEKGHTRNRSMEELKINLPPLQLSVYDYVAKNKKVEYSKEVLLEVFNLTSKTVLTRGVNNLLKKSLVEEVEENDKIYLKLAKTSVKSTLDNEFDESIGKKIELNTVKQATVDAFDEEINEQKKVIITEGKTLTLEPINEVVEKSISISKELVPTVEKVDSKVIDPTGQKQEVLETSKIDFSPKTENVIKQSQTIKKEVIAFGERKKGVEPCASPKATIEKKEQTLELFRSESVIKNFQNIGLSKDEIMNLIDTTNKIDKLIIKMTQLDNTLSKNQYLLMMSIYKYYLKNDTWIDNQNAKVIEMTGLSKSATVSCKKKIIDKGYICLTDNTTSNGTQKIALTHIGAKKIAALVRKCKVNLLVTQMKSTSNSNGAKGNSTVKEVAPKLVQNQAYKNHIYLIDTENVGLLIQKSVLEQLTSDDVVLLCLSDKSGKERLSSEQLHWILEAKCKVKSLLVKTEGKGRNDLDHVLVAELVLLLTKMPEAQFIILSKDQGYLAAIKHLMERMDLKKEQILLKRQF